MESMDVDILNDENDAESQVISSNTNFSRRFSDVWKEYDLTPSNTPQKWPIARCKHCGKTSFAPSRLGTSNLRRHLLKCPARPKSLKDGSSNKKLDQQLIRQLIAKDIIRYCHSFKFAEVLSDLFRSLNSCVVPVTRSTIEVECFNLHKEMKLQLKNSLRKIPSRICLTSHLWTSPTSRCYLCLSAHYVDENWKLQSKILNFYHVPPPYKATLFYSLVNSMLIYWGIEKKIFSITLDNARNMDNMQDLLCKKLDGERTLLSHGEFFHIHCCAHTLDLVIQDGLKVLGNSLRKVRFAVQYVAGSESRMMRFKECARQVNLDLSKGLRLDIVTRWKSTYLMLDRFFYYYDAFKILPLKDPVYQFGDLPTEEELRKFEQISCFLKPFYDFSTLFSRAEYPTANLYFVHVCMIRSKLLEEIKSSGSCLKEMATTMKENFDKYWDEHCAVLAFAVILDPCFKLEFVRFCLERFDPEFEITTQCILDKFKKLFEEYETTSISNSFDVCTDAQGGATEHSELYKEFLAQRSTSSSKKSQLEIYLSDPIVDQPTALPFDVLAFWRNNFSRYPTLATMARDILSIPMTAVALDSAFSVGGEVLNKWRSSLTYKAAEMLVTTRSWLCGYKVDQDEDEDIALTIALNSSSTGEGDSNVLD